MCGRNSGLPPHHRPGSVRPAPGHSEFLVATTDMMNQSYDVMLLQRILALSLKEGNRDTFEFKSRVIHLAIFIHI